MKNVSQIVLSILFIFNISVSFAQTLECKKIEFSFSPNAEKVEEVGLKVKVSLKVNDLENDTIILRTNVKMSFFGPKNIKACLINRDGSVHPLISWVDDQISVERSENIQLIKILIPNKKKATVQVTYNVFGSIVFKHGKDNDDFYTCQSSYEYYYPMNIPIREIKVSMPDSLKYFLSYKKEKKEIKDINLTLINKNKYREKCITKGNLTVNLHIPDSLFNDKRIQQYVIDMQQYIDQFSTYLSSPKNTDVIYINWRDDKERRAFGEALGNHALCDIYFNSKDLLHELLHMFLPTSVKENSNGEYFIKESIIEWLALYLSNKTNEIDIPDFTSPVSLFDTQINNHTTWNLIYIAGPSIIQQIASKCGEEKMAHIIICFLKKNQNRITSYDEFLTHIKGFLSNDLGDELDYLIKTSR